MSGPFENKLLVRCGKAPLNKLASRPAARLAPEIAALPGEDILVNNPALDVGGSIQSETTTAANGNIVCSAWNDSGEGSTAV
jgi:hypothetical protein